MHAPMASKAVHGQDTFHSEHSDQSHVHRGAPGEGLKVVDRVDPGKPQVPIMVARLE